MNSKLRAHLAYWRQEYIILGILIACGGVVIGVIVATTDPGSCGHEGAVCERVCRLVPTLVGKNMLVRRECKWEPFTGEARDGAAV